MPVELLKISPTTDADLFVEEEISSDAVNIEYVDAKVAMRLGRQNLNQYGQVFYIDFTLLSKKLGEKWPHKREAVFEYVNQTFSKKFQAPNWCMAANEHGAILYIPTLSLIGSAAACKEIYIQTMQHFIGAFWPENLPVAAVSVDLVARIQMKKLNYNKINKKIANNDNYLNDDKKEEAPAINEVTIDNRFIVDSSLEPFYQTKNQKVIGYRFAPRIFELPHGKQLLFKDMVNLPTNIREQIEYANFEIGFQKFLRFGGDLNLIYIPFSFAVLNSMVTKGKIIPVLNHIRDSENINIILEFMEYENYPVSKVYELASTIRPSVKAIFGAILTGPVDKLSVPNMPQYRFDAFSFDGQILARNPEHHIKYLKILTNVVKNNRGMVVVRGLDSVSQIEIADKLGAVFSCVRT
ncbi:hypothetical protein [Pseudaquidulcibacter saccharophilus]|uniref:hypothetical protein n=1 Tax=Pseudaquidulcibacter saccharophilus TaxID=2831900 RepID=UPI001EFF0BF6|nr:hypothetical protein [Pseudaquidulcibacter saccharophilus]